MASETLMSYALTLCSQHSPDQHTVPGPERLVPAACKPSGSSPRPLWGVGWGGGGHAGAGICSRRDCRVTLYQGTLAMVPAAAPTLKNQRATSWPAPISAKEP